LHALADKSLRGDGFRTVTGLLGWWLARMVALGARGAVDTTPEIVSGERALAHRLLAAAPPSAWASAWASIGQLAERTDAINLDRKRSLIGMFLTLEATAQGKAA
jgi:DNA polymerase-3 subunit delta'